MPFTPRTISDNFEKLPFSDDEKALLRRCLETPWDDAPLLVYADWVEEHGEEERADFIRKQVRTGKKIHWEEVPKSFRGWCNKISKSTNRSGVGFRGLPSHAQLDSYFESPKKLNASLSRLPWDWIFSVQYESGSSEINEAFFSNPKLLQLTDLHLSAGTTEIDDEDEDEVGTEVLGDPMSGMLESPYLTNLTKLHFDFPLPANRLSQIVQAPNLTNLTSIWFDGSFFGKAEMKAVTEKNTLNNLTEFCIECGELNFDALNLLATSEFAKQLTSLRLNHTKIKAKGAKLIAESANCQNLRVLKLYGCSIGNTGLKSLLESPYLRGLQELDIGSNSISKQGILLLCESPNVSNLVGLDLSWNRFDNSSIQALVNSPHLGSLKNLNLNECELSDNMLRTLFNSEFLEQIQILSITGNNFGDDIVEIITESTHIQNLKELNFEFDSLEPKDEKLLRKSPNLQGCRLINDYD